MLNEFDDKQYDEDFILRAVVISHSRSRSIKEVAALLCVPAELLEKWKNCYSKKIEIQYLPEKHIRNKNPSLFFLPIPNYKKVKKNMLERCPGCNSFVVFDSIKRFPVQKEKTTEIGSQHSWTKEYGVFPVNLPYVKVTTERFENCPNCGLYVIRYVTEKFANSET